jgi:hypothetical protein
LRPGRRAFDTGASWKGKIGHARLVIRFSAMKGYSFMDRPIPPGHRLVRDWYDFEPTPDDNFNIDFWSPPPKALLNDKWLVLEPEIARLAPFRGGDFVVPVRWLADKIGATVAWNQETRTGTLKRGDAEVALAIGRSHDSAANEVRGRIEQGRLMVSARDAITELGGNFTTWPSVSKFVLTLPPPAKSRPKPKPALADYTTVEAAGGSLRAMDEQPSVVMKSEQVDVTITSAGASVDCVFVLENEGPATDVKMGFPERGWGVADPEQPRGFVSFHSSVDDDVVPTKIEGLEIDKSSWRRWRTNVVPFAAGQTRRVEVRYQQKLGETPQRTRFFTYDLETGASWKGKIGQTRLRVDFRDVTGYACMDGDVLEHEDLRYKWRNYEPTAENNYFIEFYPPPPPVVLNGERLTLETRGPPLPRFHEGELLVPVRWLAKQIGATVTWDQATRTASLWRGDVQLALAVRGTNTEPTATEDNDSERQPLERPVWGRVESFALVISARDVIEAFGGSTDWRGEAEGFVMTLPPLPAD